MPFFVLHHHPPLSLSVSHRHTPSTSSSSSSSCFPVRTQRSTVWVHPTNQVGQLSWRPTTIRCMAKPRRVAMVAKQIRRELSDMLLTDKVLQFAILPEAALGADRYLSSLTTISDVEVSSDLQVVKVYVSVFGDERGKEIAIAGLKSKAKYVRSELGRRMKLRLTPEIRFIEDESLERGSRVIAILDRIKNEKKSAESEYDEQIESTDASQDDKDWEEDDPDEDIIYIKLQTLARMLRSNSITLVPTFQIMSFESWLVKIILIFHPAFIQLLECSDFCYILIRRHGKQTSWKNAGQLGVCNSFFSFFLFFFPRVLCVLLIHEWEPSTIFGNYIVLTPFVKTHPPQTLVPDIESMFTS